MDIFLEYIIKKNRDAKDWAITAGGYFAALILSFIILGFVRFLGGIGFLLIAGAWYGAFWLMRSRDIEYEYILTNNELDVDKIASKRRRKHILTVDFRSVELCAKTDDPLYAADYNNAQGIIKKYDFTGISENDIYFADFAGESGKTRILFQPSDKIRESLRLINPRNVHIS